MSSHREAPEISRDPVADSTDTYAFVSPDRPDTVTLIETARERFVAGGSPFTGPVLAQDGSVVFTEGVQPTYEEVETMDFFVEGVVGTIG